jgi:hypothetical protein
MKKLWILIYVHRGFVQEPEIFIDENSALIRQKEILKKFNRDYDELEIFEKEIAEEDFKAAENIVQ